MSEPKIVWKGDKFVEPIRGQDASAFWASDSEVVYTAIPDYEQLPYRCGSCGVRINTNHWPVRCLNGHMNERSVRTK